MFPINPLKIKKRIKDYFDSNKKIKKNLKPKTEKIERETEMHSRISGEKHKIQFRFTVTGIEIEDGTPQFYCSSHTFENHVKHLDDPVMQAIEKVQEEVRKNLKIPEPKK